MPYHSNQPLAVLGLAALLSVAAPMGLAQDIRGAIEPPIVGRYEGSFVKEIGRAHV